MTTEEFMKVWNAHDGWNKCQMIEFDNSQRWFMNRKNYHPVFVETKDKDGNVTSRRKVYNSPKGFLKEDGSIDYQDLHDYLKIDEALGTLEMKTYFVGVPPEERYDEEEFCPKYTIEVHHIENVQLLCFRDDKNQPYMTEFPCSQT